jgi:pimeloyl-ACP methyl ester carboxylesterase
VGDAAALDRPAAQRHQSATWIVDADHDEALQRENTEFMVGEIPDAGLLLQPEVSHFSMLQAPRQFTDDVRRFLERKWD